jgi:hypothetical protein
MQDIEANRAREITGVEIDRLRYEAGGNVVQDRFHTTAMRVDEHEPATGLDVLDGHVLQEDTLPNSCPTNDPCVLQTLEL